MKTITQHFRRFFALVMVSGLMGTSFVSAVDVTFTSWTQGSLSTSAEYTAIADKSIVTKITFTGSNVLDLTDMTSIKTDFENLAILDMSAVSFYLPTFPQIFGVDGININKLPNPSKLETISLSLNITEIAPVAFKNCTELTTVNLVPTVNTTIGQQAFFNCAKLTNIDLANVTFVGGGNFRACSSIKAVVFPENITTTPNSIFYDCMALESVTLPISSTLSLGLTVFTNTYITKVICKATSIPTVTGVLLPNYSGVKLYVPTDLVAAYRASTEEPWASFTDENIFSTSELTSVETVTASKSTLIYPNPVKENFSINSEEYIKSVEVISLAGQVFKTFNAPASSYSVQGLNAGNYFVRVLTHTNSEVHKIVVTK